MNLGEKILELRKKKGFSQEELGDRIGVTRQTISNWELGETSPNPGQLKLLSKELNVSIDELLDNDIKTVLEEKVSNTEKLSRLILKLINQSIEFLHQIKKQLNNIRKCQRNHSIYHLTKFQVDPLRRL